MSNPSILDENGQVPAHAITGHHAFGMTRYEVDMLTLIYGSAGAQPIPFEGLVPKPGYDGISRDSPAGRNTLQEVFFEGP